MKRITLILSIVLCLAAGLAARQNDRESGNQDTSKEAAADASSSESEQETEKVLVHQTPFGTVRTTEAQAKPPEVEVPLAQFEIEEKGNSVTFKRKTPFGISQWTKSRNELTKEDRDLLARYRESKAADRAPRAAEKTSGSGKTTVPAAGKQQP